MDINKKSLTIEKINDHYPKIIFGENRHIGYATRDVDVYYYFDGVTQSRGFCGSHSLRMTADLLDEINQDRDNISYSHRGERISKK